MSGQYGSQSRRGKRAHSVLTVYRQRISVLTVYRQRISVLTVYRQRISVLTVYRQRISVLTMLAANAVISGQKTKGLP